MCLAQHNVPTSSRKKFSDISTFIENDQSREQVLAIERNVEKFELCYFGMADKRQGIVHTIGPEQGFTIPGCTCVCGDSHTATHGAFGALAFGIGPAEVEHGRATQVRGEERSARWASGARGGRRGARGGRGDGRSARARRGNVPSPPAEGSL